MVEKHPERVPPWNRLLASAATRSQTFTSSDPHAVARVSASFRGTPIEEIPPSPASQIVSWSMYRTVIGEGSDDPRFWRQLYWLHRQEEQMAAERELAAEGWEFKRYFR